MTTSGMIYDYIDALAPYDTQLGFDNSGYMIGSRAREIKKVLVCLDVTEHTAKLAKEKACQLIISHHPIIFRPLRSVDSNSVVYRLIADGIDVLSAHTNLDIAEGGVNTCLAQSIGLENIEPINGAEVGMAGELPESLEPVQFAVLVKEKLGCGAVSYTDGGKNIRTVAVIGGEGSDEIPALIGNIDAIVTGETKHHLLLAARDGGCTLVVAGHFETERTVVRPLAQKLAEEFPEVQFIPAEEEISPVRFA